MTNGRNEIEGTGEHSGRRHIGGFDVKHIAVKGGGVLAIIIVIFVVYMVIVSTSRAKARFVLTDHEIQDVSEDVESQRVYPAGSKVYFLVNKRNGRELGAGHFVIEIAREEGGKLSGPKQISFEIDKDFTKLSTYIPVDYFKNKGKFSIKAFLDGKPLSSQEIEVE
jgi:hypothetical protein